MISPMMALRPHSRYGVFSPPGRQRRNLVMSRPTERESHAPNMLAPPSPGCRRELIIPCAMSVSATSFTTVSLDELLLAVMELKIRR
jgi:hypothetical protein